MNVLTVQRENEERAKKARTVSLYRLQTTDYRLQSTDYRLQSTDSRVQTTPLIGYETSTGP